MGKEIKTVKKDKTSLWIILVIAVLIVGALGLWWYTGSGIRDRSTTVVESENYEVDGAMLPYFQMMMYNEYANEFNQYYSTFLAYGFDDASAKSYASSYVGGPSPDTLTLADFTPRAVSYAREALINCEAAKISGMELEADDYEAVDALLAQIDNDIKSIDDYFRQMEATTGQALISIRNYTDYFNYLSGGIYSYDNIKASDLRSAIEIYALSSKYLEKFVKDTNAATTADDIANFIENNKASFYSTDYIAIELSALAEDYADTPEEFEAVKALIDEYADKLEKADDIKEFRSLIIEYIVKSEFDAMAEDVDAEESVLEAAKLEAIANIKEILIDGKTAEEKTAEEGTVEYDLNKIESDLLASCESAITIQNQPYTEEHKHEEGEEVDHEDTPIPEEVKWLVSFDSKAGDTKVVPIADEANTKHGATVFMIETPSRISDEITKNVGHILIAADEKATEEEVAAAKAKAEEILATYKAGEMTEEAFEALAWENTSDSGVFSNNVRRGQMVDEFEDWLFDDARQIGDTDIVKTPYGFHVMLYRGEEAYKDYLAKNGIANEKYSEHLDANESSVTVNEEAVAKYSNAAK